MIKKICLPQPNHYSHIIYYMLIYVFVMLLVQSFGVPHAIVFLLDIFNLILLVNLLYKKNFFVYGKLPIVKFQLTIFVSGILVAVVRQVDLLLIAWSLRNYMRFVIFFVACVAFIKAKTAKLIISTMEKLYILNFVICLIQFFVFRIDGDMLGGIFGTYEGCNGYSNVFLTAMTTLFVFKWIYGHLSMKSMLTYVSLAVLQAALGEIKVYFVELFLIMFVAFIKVCVIDKRIKKIQSFFMAAVIVVFVMIIGIWIIGILRPEFKNFFTVSKIMDIVSNERGYSADGKSINRLNAIRSIDHAVDAPFITRLLGHGQGAAEYSQSSAKLTSPFYHSFSSLKYKNFLLSWMYIENGFIGLVLYFASFIFTVKQGLKKSKRTKDTTGKILIATGTMMAFVSLLLVIYSATLRVDSAYLVYFFISLIYIKYNDMKENFSHSQRKELK